jgi:hypothetical protein
MGHGGAVDIWPWGYHALGAKTRPARLGSATRSLGPAEPCAGCKLARLGLFRPAPGVCRPPEGLQTRAAEFVDPAEKKIKKITIIIIIVIIIVTN